MKWLTRTFLNFRDDPASVRRAAAAIISTIVVLVAIGALFMWLADRDDYPTYGSALWFSLQTVTTVGYGDNPPTSSLGRVVASIVMLLSIGLFTVVTAAVTSIFIQGVKDEQQRADQVADSDALARIEATLASVRAQLDELSTPSDAEPTDGST